MSTETITSVLKSQKSQQPSWLARHSMLTYGILVYGISWGLLVCAMIIIQNTSMTLDGPFGAVVNQISASSPAIAALIVIAATQGRKGVKELLRRIVQWRVPVRWYLFAFLGIPLMIVTGYSLIFGAPLFRSLLDQWPIVFTVFLPVVAVTMIETGLAEEPGWRGFALPRLQARHGALLGSLLLGIFWAMWHLPNMLFSSWGLSFGALQIVAVMLNTFILTWTYNRTRESILIAMLLHAAVNKSPVLLSALAGDGDAAFRFQIYTAGLISMSVLVLALILLTRGRLGYQPDRSS